MQGLSESRRFGGCFVLAFQDPNQLDSLYGVQIAKTFDSLMTTKIIFQLDSHAAKQIAGLLGEQEISESQRSISFGAHEVRDGVSIADRHYTRALVSPTDIMNLPKLHAYLQFLGDLPLTQVKFPIYRCPQISAAFIGETMQKTIGKHLALSDEI